MRLKFEHAVGCYSTLNAAVCERYDQSSEAKRKLVLLELEVGFLIDEYIIEKTTLLKSLFMKR